VKTGSTTPAGFCLASWYKNDGVNMLVIVLGCPSDEIRYDDSLSLVRWAIK
jgi:D-alanyl-D-alanine carboxypeptidase (penicillin-binding protein 5/6)